MPNKRAAVTAAFIITANTITLAPITHACGYHGFYGASYFGHERSSGTMLYDSPFSQSSESKPEVELSLPSMLRAKVLTDKALKVRYTTEKENASIQLVLGEHPGITVENNKVGLTGKNGEHTFILRPKKTGIYQLTVSAWDQNDPSMPTLNKPIYLNIYD